VLVVRFFFVYGHGQKPGMLVPRLIDTIRAGKEVPLAGDHGPRLNPTHVSDAARAVTAAIERRTTGRIDIAGPDTLTVREMSEAIGQHLGISPRFACDAAQRPIDLLGDTTMMRQKLVAPRCAFDEGIAEVFGAGARSAR
jgi:UDP-glucose 4-epimerase